MIAAARRGLKLRQRPGFAGGGNPQEQERAAVGPFAHDAEIAAEAGCQGVAGAVGVDICDGQGGAGVRLGVGAVAELLAGDVIEAEIGAHRGRATGVLQGDEHAAAEVGHAAGHGAGDVFNESDLAGVVPACNRTDVVGAGGGGAGDLQFRARRAVGVVERVAVIERDGVAGYGDVGGRRFERVHGKRGRSAAPACEHGTGIAGRGRNVGEGRGAGHLLDVGGAGLAAIDRDAGLQHGSTRALAEGVDLDV